MNTQTILSVSPQGQLTIPKKWRDILGITKGKKIYANLNKQYNTKTVILSPEPVSWAQYSAGLCKEIWKGVNIKKYIKKQRAEWDKK